MQVITSKDNEIIKSIKKLKEKKYRDQENKFIVEGVKMIKEAILEKPSEEEKIETNVNDADLENKKEVSPSKEENIKKDVPKKKKENNADTPVLDNCGSQQIPFGERGSYRHPRNRQHRSTQRAN